MRRTNGSVPASLHFGFMRVFVAGAETGRSYTVAEMAERFEIAPSTAWKWVRMMRDADLLYIKDWPRVGKVRCASFAFGFKEDDAPKPAPLTQAEYERTYRARKKLAKQSSIAVMAGHLT